MNGMKRRGRELFERAAFVPDKANSARACSHTSNGSFKALFLLRTCPRWHTFKQCGSVTARSLLVLCCLAAECASLSVHVGMEQVSVMGSGVKKERQQMNSIATRGVRQRTKVYCQVLAYLVVKQLSTSTLCLVRFASRAFFCSKPIDLLVPIDVIVSTLARRPLS